MFGLFGGLLGVGVIMWIVVNVYVGGKIFLLGIVYFIILLFIFLWVGKLIEVIF